MNNWKIISLIFLILTLFNHPSNLSFADETTSLGAGMVLTFDDDEFDSWCEYKSIFTENNIKVTFFLTRPHKFKKRFLECIKELIADGHEIAAHGYEHQRPDHYVEKYGLEKFINDEILGPLKILKTYGIYPMAYAYPSGGSTREIKTALKNYFMIQRGSSHFRYGRNYYKWDEQFFVHGSSADVDRDSTEEEVFDSIKMGAENKRVTVLYAHRIAYPSERKNNITPDRLKEIIKRAKEYQMPFYRISELWFLDKYTKSQKTNYRPFAIYSQGNIELAKDLLKNRWTVTPQMGKVELPSPGQLTWEENPYNDKNWRQMFYSLRPLSHLLYAYNKSKNIVYIQKMQEILLSFLDKGVGSRYIKDPLTAGYLGLGLVFYYKSLEKLGLLLPELKNKIPAFLQTNIEFLKAEENYTSDINGIFESMSLSVMGMNFPLLPNAFDAFQLGRTRFLSFLDSKMNRKNEFNDQEGLNKILVEFQRDIR